MKESRARLAQINDWQAASGKHSGLQINVTVIRAHLDVYPFLSLLIACFGKETQVVSSLSNSSHKY